MPVQDLTPQLRTRLSRVERAVGWFVMIATLLLLAGFAYYVYATAQRKGWFLTKLRYHTFVQSAAGLHVGDAVKLMGFDVGQITWITAMPPFSASGNVYIEFTIREPYYGYIWTDSYVKLTGAGLLGSRSLEVVQGGTSTNKDLHASYAVDKNGHVTGIWDGSSSNYVAYTADSKGYGLRAAETPVITDRLEEIAEQAKNALPGILNLTNELNRVLAQATRLSEHADSVLVQAQPILTNAAVISAALTNGPGSLGEWAIPTNLLSQLQQTLGSAKATLGTANTSMVTVAQSLNVTLENLANITSNLNQQVQTNDQILSQLSAAVVHADDFVQGLKHHWLLRSAFKKEKTNAPPAGREERPAAPAAPKTGKRLLP